MKRFLHRVWVVLCFMCAFNAKTWAGELNVKVNINRQQISNTTEAVFEALQQQITTFMTDHVWTTLAFEEREKINCTFNITLKTYSATDNSFTGSIQVMSTRPVWNSNYTTTLFNFQDENFNFNFQQFDQLEFRPEQVDNNLTAVLAYYAYLIIGLDMDSMAPLGGTTVLQQALDVANNAQNLGASGWKAFEDGRNRFGIINDYLDGGLEAFRTLQYNYHYMGLDHMTQNTDSARAHITQCMSDLKAVHEQKSMSALPVIFTDIKRDELVNIYSNKAPADEREKVYNILMAINASQSNNWEKMRK